jgi:5-methyltetrahydropteroyltriglutamate--homocysteine methyltransferase
MRIRDNDVLLPTTAINAFPRPHWLQGRVLGSLQEPVYRSHNLRVAYEDATKICAREQERAGLDMLVDGAQYYEWEAPGFQLEPIFHFIPENLGGFAPYGPPGDGAKYAPFYKARVTSQIEWKRPIFEPLVNAMSPPPTSRSRSRSSVRRSRASSWKTTSTTTPSMWPGTSHGPMNQELKYLVSMGLEGVQLIDVLAPYTQDMWQIEVQDIMFEGIDILKFWHVCYGSVDGQRDVFTPKTQEMLPLFEASPVDVIHVESCSSEFSDLDPYRDFPKDKILGLGVVDAKNYIVEPAEVIADRIRQRLEVVPADRFLVAPDCGLGYFSRSTAWAKLREMGKAVEMVRNEL